MARKPTFKTLESIVEYYLSLYYIVRDRNPGLLHNEAKHIHKIELLERDYHKELIRVYPDQVNEGTKDKLRQRIDFLTKVFTRQKESQEKKLRLQSLKEKVKR